MVAAGPQAGDVPRLLVGEDAGARHDLRVLRASHGHLNHVDAEQGRLRVFLRILVRAAREFLGRPRVGRPRPVDVHVGRVLRVGHERVRVRATTGLHGRHLSGSPHVADVEDADPAKALLAHRSLDTAHATVETPARLLHRHEQQIAVHRHVTLPARADHRRQQRGLRRVGDVVDVEAAEVADEQVVSAEREVGVGEVQPTPRLGRRLRLGRGLLLLAFLALFALLRLRLCAVLLPFVVGHARVGLARGRVRVEEAVRLGHVGEQLEPARGDTRVAQARLQPDARIRRRGRRGRLRTDRHDKGQNDGRGGQHTNETHHFPSSFNIAPMRAISIA